MVTKRLTYMVLGSDAGHHDDYREQQNKDEELPGGDCDNDQHERVYGGK